MAKSKYGKYIVTDLKEDIKLPAFRSGEQGQLGQGTVDGKRYQMDHMIWMDSEVIPGAFYCEGGWAWAEMNGVELHVFTTDDAENNPLLAPHSHPFPELLAFFGTNFDDPSDLGGVVEFWLEDEMYLMDKSFVLYIPENVVHCPLRTRSQTRHFFHFTMGPGGMYV